MTVEYARTWQMLRCAQELCWTITTLQCSKWAAINIVMTLGTLLLHTFRIFSVPSLVQDVITKHIVFQHTVITNYSYSTFETIFGDYVQLPVRDLLSMIKPFVDLLFLWYGSSLRNLSNKHNFLEKSAQGQPYVAWGPQWISFRVLIGVGTVHYVTELRNAVSVGTAVLCKDVQ